MLWRQNDNRFQIGSYKAIFHYVILNCEGEMKAGNPAHLHFKRVGPESSVEVLSKLLFCRITKKFLMQKQL